MVALLPELWTSCTSEVYNNVNEYNKLKRKMMKFQRRHIGKMHIDTFPSTARNQGNGIVEAQFTFDKFFKT